MEVGCWTRIETYVVLLLCTLGITQSEPAVDMALLHTTVRDMLGFTQSPLELARSPPDDLTPPEYMKQLYEMYNTGSLSSATDGDTVRSIYPLIRTASPNPGLIFNLSALERASQILGAYLRVFRPNKSDRNLTISLVESLSHVELQEVVTHKSRGKGWLSVNITTLLSACTTRTFPQSCFLHVAYGHNKIAGLSRHPKPFIVVFSNDKQPKRSTKIQKRINKNRNRPKGRRSRRSVFDNEIPQGPVRLDWTHLKFAKSHPSILIARRQKQFPRKSKRLPFSRRRKHRRGRKYRRRHHKRKGHRKRKLPVPKSWKIMQHNLATSQDISMLCGRHKLLVNFADIGWGEWIISPKTFDANYCAGTCPFPLTRSVHPSNHATIQSIVHALGLNPHVPAPCCVADAMTSITLLYFDEHKNVVLKNYPRMSVVSCSCR